MIVSRIDVPNPPADRSVWPFDVPFVDALVRYGLGFTAPVTFLVGENGSGKSTLVAAIAEAYGLDARGGRAGRKYGNTRPKTPLGELLRLELTAAGARLLHRAEFGDHPHLVAPLRDLADRLL